jgi:hypothetical protein
MCEVRYRIKVNGIQREKKKREKKERKRREKKKKKRETTFFCPHLFLATISGAMYSWLPHSVLALPSLSRYDASAARPLHRYIDN